ncbi:GspH/FimT family pseudopilin [Thalassotalea sp. Y01]|uniref:GspH/FimT family pseudopilin n=1 Tax=Thalassotalea sp. Y01 TaxID=2729613 RepID=UPI00145D32C2|nr:GspH/FimT family pseudopilin [Thalassotalea sp. Y01]NMP14853.1 prepilin-type N-terminal cleavage/methylation domain-containing protein [Thalassotalea sp. Y01]
MIPSNRISTRLPSYAINGVTLIELIVAISIIAILSTVALPSIKPLILQKRMMIEVNKWQQGFAFARQAAIRSANVVTLCPSSDGLRCTDNWQQGAMVFADLDGDKSKSTDETVLYRIGASKKGFIATWRSFQNRNYIQFQHNGFTWYQNGTLRLCIEGENQRYNRALIVTRAGRVRASQDNDGDGLHDDASGESIQCH